MAKTTSTTSDVNQEIGAVVDTAIGGIDANRLRSFVERIQALDGEHREIAELMADIYEEAGLEFDKRALKKVISRLRRGRADVDAEDFLVAQYELAVGIGPRGEAPEIIRVEDIPDLSGLASAGARARTRGETNGAVAPRHEAAYADGREDGLNDHHGSSDLWPPGEYGHGDYMLGWETGHTERVDGQTPIMPAKAPRVRRKARADA